MNTSLFNIFKTVNAMMLLKIILENPYKFIKKDHKKELP